VWERKVGLWKGGRERGVPGERLNREKTLQLNEEKHQKGDKRLSRQKPQGKKRRSDKIRCWINTNDILRKKKNRKEGGKGNNEKIRKKKSRTPGQLPGGKKDLFS